MRLRMLWVWRASAYGEEDEGAACAWAGAGRSGATVTEAARRREDGRSWRQIAAVWMHDGMAAVTKFIRGYVTDTREYAANMRIRESSIFEHIRAYASIREFAGQYQRLSKFTQIFTNTRIGYSPIRGHTRTFAQVHRDVSAYALGHVSHRGGGSEYVCARRAPLRGVWIFDTAPL